MLDFIVGGATLNQTPMDWEGNLFNICQAIESAKNQSIKLLCLPELSITGYGCEDMFLSEWLPEKACTQLQKILPHTKGIAVAVGLPMRLHGHVYNCVALIEDTNILGIVPKQNLPLEGVHYENRWFTPWIPGELTTCQIKDLEVPFGDAIYRIGGYRIGFEICEDAWRTSRPADRLVEQGVDIILNPSASHFALEKFKIREAIVKNSSEKYRCLYVYANLLGNEAGRMIYDGDILIAEQGKIVRRNDTLSFRPFEIVSYNVSAPTDQELAAHRDNNEEFTRAVALALFDYLRKSKTKGFVVSLSGGADSATCASLVHIMIRYGVKVLGKQGFYKAIGQPDLSENLDIEKITGKLLACAYQATKNSSQETRDAAYELAHDIGATFYEWNIDDVVASYTGKIATAINEELTWAKHDLVLQNIQARARSPIIWMLANQRNSLLLVTSNRSEGDVGYATMDGDTSGSIAPIAGIDKAFIRQWLKWAEQDLDLDGLKLTNRLVPTAELRPSDQHQTDEDDLMPYATMVEIERLAIRDRKSPVQVYHALIEQLEVDPEDLKQYIKRFFRLWSINQWKRERTAPSFHLDDFNVDPRTWCRFPILSSNFRYELEELEKQS